MAVTKITIERFNVISNKPFDSVVAAVKASVGQPNMVEFEKAIRSAASFAELERAVSASLSEIELMLFMELDQGMVVRKQTGRDTPKIVRLLIGNPLIMKEMARHVPDAGSYAPVTVLIDERGDGVHLSYDRMASFLEPYGNAEAMTVARKLDSKIESLLSKSAA
jgi:uncharacterized protein (DUF302 family)